MYSQPVTITVLSDEVIPAQTTSEEITPTDTQPTDPSTGVDGQKAFSNVFIVPVVAIVAVSGAVAIIVVTKKAKSKK